MKKNLLCKYKTKKAFTLIEILVAILILSSVLILWFQLYTKALASKVKIDEQANLEKNIYYFSERLFQLIKKWWTLDYEEYFNRNVSKLFRPENLVDWNWNINTWFWNFWRDWNFQNNNFWNWFYYCLRISTDDFKNHITKPEYNSVDEFEKKWCFWWSSFLTHNKNINFNIPSHIQSWSPQRYWQYSFQFIDYNSNADDDGWDEDGDWNIIWDDDDKHLWRWPEVFDSGSDVKELYLLSWDKKTRTFFRWYIKKDEYVKDDTKDCESELTKDSNWYWIPKSTDKFQYCRWTIQFLQLEGKDWWMDHNSNNIDDDKTQNDWVVDTWVIASNFSWKSNSDSDNTVIAWTWEDKKYWKELFSDSINISDFKVFAYPNIDSSKVWDITPEEQKKYKISPYVILSFEVKPSWKVKAKISWWEIKPIRFNTTINLTDIFSK